MSERYYTNCIPAGTRVLTVPVLCLKCGITFYVPACSSQMTANWHVCDYTTAPTITKLVEAARNFAARVEERNPEWFREERGTTDFSEADHALRAALAELEKP